ncbi:hypothetical protein Pint_06843 [Pistacia integerrima]|uniref:Uncharacterized protein n=1 Tax=Pistacia integerrima TaxID=434235 RepID=A0ACC0XVM7_9ROSI|nr:hypothetical protein Pint_06843 [Pistacia integerrima]
MERYGGELGPRKPMQNTNGLGENVRSMVIRLVRTEHGAETRRVDDLHQRLQMRGFRCNLVYTHAASRGDTDYENLLAGLQKTVIVRGTVDYSSGKLLHGEESSKREDSAPQDSPNIAM